MLPAIRPLRSLLVAGALLAAPLALPAEARADDAATGARAADLYRQATRLYSERKLAAAEPLYRQAWDLHQSYEIASNYGALELELGNPRLAAELLERAVSSFPVRGKAEERTALEARSAQARKLVGALRVKVSAPGAEVLVDGQSVGRSPLPAQVLVQPGLHRVSARLPGFTESAISFSIAEGQTFNVSLPLPLAPPPSPREPRKRSAVPLLAGGAVAVGTAVVGGVLVALAEGQRGNANALHAAIAGVGRTCAIPSPDCDQLHAASGKADALGNTGIGFFAVAGVAAVGTATYVLWPWLRPTVRRPLDVRASLGVGPGGALATVTGSF